MAQTQAKVEQFALRFAFRALLTLPLVLITMARVYDVTAMNVVLGVFAAGALTALYGMIFGDHLAWMQVRGNRWVLTDRRLILLPRNEPQAEVPLAAIVSVKRWFWWSLRVHLASRLAIRLDFIADPRSFRDHLIRAAQHAKGEP